MSSTTRRTLLVLALSGCAPVSHVLLSPAPEPADARDELDADAGSAERFWARCVDLLESDAGAHMDACGWGGNVCYDGYGAGRSAACLEDRVLFSRDEALEHHEEACRGELYVGPLVAVDLVSVGDGCVELDVCGGGGNRRWRSCQLPPLPAVRDGAPLEPWTDCGAAVQAGIDGDRCEGSLACIASRSYGETRSSNELLVVCDAGILRMFSVKRQLVSGGD